MPTPARPAQAAAAGAAASSTGPHPAQAASPASPAAAARQRKPRPASAPADHVLNVNAAPFDPAAPQAAAGGGHARGAARAARGKPRKPRGQGPASSAQPQPEAEASAASPATLPSGLSFSIQRTATARPQEPAQPQPQQQHHHHHQHNHNHTHKAKPARGGHAHAHAPRGPPARRSDAVPAADRPDASLLVSLTEDLTNEVYDCMVCYDTVKSRDRVWSCTTCYAVFHLKCITQWARKSAQEFNGADPSRSMESWRCPGCQSFSDRPPTEYRCFCSKTLNPARNPYGCPHSCGQTCRKERQCPHPCPLECHPGPCPPCDLMAPPIQCFCRKSELHVRCTEMSSIDFTPVCGRTCERTLDCGKHKCTMVCHPPPCQTCTETLEISCFCGSETKTIRCGEPEDGYSCGKPCQYVYACGVHKCERPCHADKHESAETCPLDPSLVRRCPCGKFSVDDLAKDTPRTSCEQPVLLCGRLDRCNKIVQEQCRCGKETIKITCFARDFDASGKPLPLNAVCGKQLACKLHTCMMTCGHQGKCHDCVEGVSFEEQSCHCGRTVMYPPIPCNAPPLKCDHPCCTAKCGRVRATCGHTCGEACHGTLECPESAICKHAVVLSCPCGNRTKQTLCGATKDKPASLQALECDDSCLRRKRNESLAEALGIDANAAAAAIATAPTAAAVFPDTLIRAALTFRDVTLMAERVLAELVADPSRKYHYFPKQRFSAANTLIIELAGCYGFHAQLLDANIGKGTVSVRRFANKPVFIPTKLLSRVAEEYDPAAAAAAAASEATDLMLDLEPFAPNAVLVTDVPLEAELLNIKAILRPVCNIMNLAGKIRWITDTDFVILYERYSVWGSIKEKDAEIPSMLADRVNVAMVHDIGWASSVVECQVVNASLVRLADNSVLRRDPGSITHRKTGTGSGTGAGSDSEDGDGWTAVRLSKIPDIPINEDFVAPTLPEGQIDGGGGSSSGKRRGKGDDERRRQWFDESDA
ncbi:FKBP12-associated protein [Polyrhizophydium stewartii]|uniref:FKBP12-associated protein n=1 Tax=Polyrhizophydium stewartii TaxID=2732419 RepID=A0ABR4N112_9FUNG